MKHSLGTVCLQHRVLIPQDGMQSPVYFFFFFKKINLSLALLGDRGCVRAFSSCREWGLLFTVVAGFSPRWVLWLQSTGSRLMGFNSCNLWAQQLWRMGLVALWDVECSQARHRTYVPCTGRQRNPLVFN